MCWACINVDPQPVMGWSAQIISSSVEITTNFSLSWKWKQRVGRFLKPRVYRIWSNHVHVVVDGTVWQAACQTVNIHDWMFESSHWILSYKRSVLPTYGISYDDASHWQSFIFCPAFRAPDMHRLLSSTDVRSRSSYSGNSADAHNVGSQLRWLDDLHHHIFNITTVFFVDTSRLVLILKVSSASTSQLTQLPSTWPCHVMAHLHHIQQSFYCCWTFSSDKHSITAW